LDFAGVEFGAGLWAFSLAPVADAGVAAGVLVI